MLSQRQGMPEGNAPTEERVSRHELAATRITRVVMNILYKTGCRPHQNCSGGMSADINIQRSADKNTQPTADGHADGMKYDAETLAGERIPADRAIARSIACNCRHR